jgi:hypothetical protein
MLYLTVKRELDRPLQRSSHIFAMHHNISGEDGCLVTLDHFGTRAAGRAIYGKRPHWWKEPDQRPLERMLTMGDVVFLGVADGKHRCRPATEEKSQRPVAAQNLLKEFIRLCC